MSEAGLPFMVMEDADGRCWDEVIAEGTLVELPRMLDVAIQSADGLAWLHSQGRIHYNLKPANVLICRSGSVKLWKYGEPGAMTKAYAAPEQMAGKPLSEACDVWCWATSVLQMFVGKVAWSSGPKARLALRRYRQNGPDRPAIARMPGALMELLATCLTEDPAERTIRMDEITELLEGIYRTAVGRSYSAPVSQTDAPPGTGRAR
jgi:serine/threonine protein kinase